MVFFGKPPESDVLSYPGISGKRFNPVEAGKCWGEALATEKASGYVHRMLDAHGKLNLPAAWAQDVSRSNGFMPSYESLDEAKYILGWKSDKFGRSFQPDIRQYVPALRQHKVKKVREKKVRDLDVMSEADVDANCQRSWKPRESLARSASEPGVVADPTVHWTSRLASVPLPDSPPPNSRSQTRIAPPTVGSQKRAAPSTAARSVAAMSQASPAAFGLPTLRTGSERSYSQSSLQKGSRRDKIASLVCNEVSSQCSDLLDGSRR